MLHQLLLFPSAGKKAKKDEHKVGQKKQQKAKKGSDVDSNVSSEEDGYLDSKEMDYLSDSSSSLEGETFFVSQEGSFIFFYPKSFGNR